MSRQERLEDVGAVDLQTTVLAQQLTGESQVAQIAALAN